PGPAERTADRHAVVMAAASGLEALGLLLRAGPGAPAHPLPAAAVALFAAGALMVGGWLGGELVYRHGVGVQALEKPCPPSR
ncbi:MAG: DUF2231 domain-containing protein, partial [Elusimicrobia bacterium]|nr:DUF2231 domain-containing protein [Elusimicrobiota bacterium]